MSRADVAPLSWRLEAVWFPPPNSPGIGRALAYAGAPLRLVANVVGDPVTGIIPAGDSAADVDAANDHAP
jgi:hypothetical protein